MHAIGIATVVMATAVTTTMVTHEVDADPAVCTAIHVDVDQLDAWNAADCSGVDQSVEIPDGRTGDIPDPGWTVTASATTAAGYEPVPDVTISRGLDGAVAVVIEDHGQHDVAVYGDAAVADAIEMDAGTTVAASSTNPKCNNGTYNTPYLSKWIEPFPYYRKSGISIPIGAIKGGIDAMANGTGTCVNVPNSAKASYKGMTTKSATIKSNGLCSGTDTINVIDAGTLPSGTLAAACTYKTSTRISYADVRFNTARYSWYTGSSTTGCSGAKYDAQGVMTHEAGHVFGLGHVANSTLQVMKTNSGKCETSQRRLGRGDLNGMKHLYP